MNRFLRGFSAMVQAVLAMAAGTAAHAAQLAYEPVALGWTAAEVERVGEAEMRALTERAEQSKTAGCSSECRRMQRVFGRLVAEARLQTARSAVLPWSLAIVRLPDVEAMSMPGGQLVVSEGFVAERLASDETLAFVLAHEMAHSILEHERQALTFARLLLPRQVKRSVRDMYVELNYNPSLLRAMEPAMQQGEYEADELGLLLASAAGFDPDRQLAFIERECRAGGGRPLLAATHPPPCSRQKALEALLPLARRQLPDGAAIEGRLGR